MSLVNNSALSCIATAVGCTLTGMAVNEHFNQPNQTNSLKLGVQQNSLMNAEDLMLAASKGVEQSVAPPGQMFTSNLTPTVEENEFSKLLSREPKIWQQSPLDIGNLVVTSRPQPRIVKPDVLSVGNLSKEFFPNYLNFDQEGEAPQKIEWVMAELPEPEMINERVSLSDFPSGLVPVPVAPPLFEGEAIAAYIVEPEPLISNNFERIDSNYNVLQEQIPSRSPAEYIVEPQAQLRDYSSASMPEFSVSDSAKLAAQYIVEPRTIIANFTSQEAPEISSTISSDSLAEFDSLNDLKASIPNRPQTALTSTVYSPTSATQAKATSPQKWVKPEQIISQIEPDEQVYSMNFTPQNDQTHAEININRVDNKPSFIIAVDSEFEIASEFKTEELETESQPMPSLLKKLVESYSGSSDIIHDIKVSPSPLGPSPSKFARQ